MIQKLPCQSCGKNHNTYRTAARCRYKSAYMNGNGPYATLHYDRAQGYGLLVYLHLTEEAANQFIKHAAEGHEGGLLYNSEHKGIWFFTKYGRWRKIG